jgi:hypothetical protein
LFGSDTNQPKLILEGHLPISEIATFIIKDDSIPGCADSPTGCDDNFSKNGTAKAVLALMTISRGGRGHHCPALEIKWRDSEFHTEKKIKIDLRS